MFDIIVLSFIPKSNSQEWKMKIEKGDLCMRLDAVR